MILKVTFLRVRCVTDKSRHLNVFYASEIDLLAYCARPPQMTMTADPTHKLTEKAELKMKTWLHIVSRTKTIPKDFVCSEECEQHSIYGRLFDGHPLNHVKSEANVA